MKETFYFSHDYNARSDPKLINLQIKHGMFGYGCYWSIIEMLYEQGGEMPLEYERMAYVLRTDENAIRSIINDFDLFIFSDNNLSSSSVLRRISERKEKSVKAKESINKRWEKHRTDTNVSKTDTNELKNDTIKESKVKESKEEETYNVNPSEKTEDSQVGDFLNSLSKKYKISSTVIAKAQVKFESFRIAYPGKKDGSDIAFQHYLEGGNLIRDIDLLLPALEKEKVYMLGKTINWKNLKTWINDKCWTQELPEPVRENVTQRKFLTYQEVANKGGQGVKDVFSNYVKVADNKYIEKTKVN